MTEPFTELVEITPKMAREWLEKNGKNRPVAQPRVDSLARDIASGHWGLDGATIKFSDRDRLLDGQHRLLACIQADKPVRSLVVYGLPESAMENIDRGRVRSVGDVLQIGGVSDANRTAAIAKVIRGIETNKPLDRAPATYSETVELVGRYGADIAWVIEHVGNTIEPAGPSGGAPVLGALAFMRRIDNAKIDDFCRKFKTGQGSETHPSRALRKAVAVSADKSYVNRQRLTGATLACIIAALNKKPLEAGRGGFIHYDFETLNMARKLRGVG